MVITMTITTVGDYVVKRVLVDQGSSTDIIYYDTYKKLGLPKEQLRSFDGSLVSFAGVSVTTVGIARLWVTIRNAPLL